MAVDEFYFHRQRGLGKWERIGHPLDTLTLLAAILVAVYSAYASPSFMLFLGLSVLSCVFVTKDEFVHAREAPPLEIWLHSLLFILHPVILLCVHELWTRGERELLQYLAVSVLSFAIYQTIYWNLGFRSIHAHAADK